MSEIQVLLVDDEESFRKLVARELGHAGYQVMAAENVEQARRLLSGHFFNIVLLDVRMPDGGTLTVRTIRVGERTVRIAIQDTGTGIATDHLDQIWDPFFTTKPVGKGTGLGLSITQRVVQRHGGSIRVESEPGRGACFVVELPVQGPGGDHV